MDLNNVNLIGRVVRDIELKTTAGGTNLTNFSLAVNNRNDTTSFFDCIAFGKTAEILERYSGKGRQLAVSGYLQQRSYEAKDRTNRRVVEIIVNNVQLLGGKSDSVQADTVPTDTSDEVDFSLIPF